MLATHVKELYPNKKLFIIIFQNEVPNNLRMSDKGPMTGI